MKSNKRAFTLIELLVVIAIIAILAAILFPVFAQAKAAAKKAASISNIKQQATCIAIYQSDADDLMPSAFGFLPTNTFGFVGHLEGLYHDVPFDWDASNNATWYEAMSQGWANNTEPYRKNLQMLETPGGRRDTTLVLPARKPLGTVGYNFNGLLHNWSATAVNAPSQLIMLSQLRGDLNAVGGAVDNPVLNCPTNTAPCRFVPSSPTCNGANGTWSQTWGNPGWRIRTMWTHGRGMVVAMADTSARFRPVAQNVRPIGSTTRVLSDFRTDPYFNYNTNGLPAGEWQDSNFCHSLLFMPDFDFQNFGNPIPWTRTGL